MHNCTAEEEQSKDAGEGDQRAVQSGAVGAPAWPTMKVQLIAMKQHIEAGDGNRAAAAVVNAGTAAAAGARRSANGADVPQNEGEVQWQRNNPPPQPLPPARTRKEKKRHTRGVLQHN